MTDDTTKAKDEARAKQLTLQAIAGWALRWTPGTKLVGDITANEIVGAIRWTLRQLDERDAELQVLLDELISKRFAPADDADNRGLTWRVHAEVWRKIEALRAKIQKRIQEGSAG